MKAERIHYEQAFNTRNVKEYPSKINKIIPDSNLDVYKETKNTRNGNYTDKCITYFLLFKFIKR